MSDRPKNTMSIRLSSTNRQLFFLDNATVMKNLADRGFADDPQLKDLERSDVTRGLYEGGMKVWEGATDMCIFIDDPKNGVDFKRKNVLELGCGSGLPGIVAALNGARHVCFQDFNLSVLECFTKDNTALNGIDREMVQFVHGDWKNCREMFDVKKFDVILTSETIYEETNYGKLHDLMDDCLVEDGSGIILLQAKNYYFGVGGNIPEFLEFVRLRGRFDPVERWNSGSDIPRWIVQLRRK